MAVKSADSVQAVSERQQELERQVSELTGALQALQTRVAELSQPAATAAAVKVAAKDELTPEILVVIAAAVTAFLGKKVRIRSARRLQSTSEVVSPWSQQGRVFIHSSHNLRSRG